MRHSSSLRGQTHHQKRPPSLRGGHAGTLHERKHLQSKASEASTTNARPRGRDPLTATESIYTYFTPWKPLMMATGRGNAHNRHELKYKLTELPHSLFANVNRCLHAFKWNRHDRQICVITVTRSKLHMHRVRPSKGYQVFNSHIGRACPSHRDPPQSGGNNDNRMCQ